VAGEGYASFYLILLISPSISLLSCYTNPYFHARLAFTMAAFNLLVPWHGFQPNASGFVPLSIAEFSL
jgi:hypothetical protein